MYKMISDKFFLCIPNVTKECTKYLWRMFYIARLYCAIEYCIRFTHDITPSASLHSA